MNNNNENSRRAFLSTTVKGALILGTGASALGALLQPASAFAQTGGSEAGLKSKILALGTASLQTSKLALTKATNAQVKLFAKFEAAEQETIGTILKEMGTTAPAPDAEGQALLAKLQKLSGAAFDKAFMQGQVETHLKLKAAVTALKNASSNAQVKHVTSLALATIQEHTERGQMLLTQLA
jgi:putative membrane protein